MRPGEAVIIIGGDYEGDRGTVVSSHSWYFNLNLEKAGRVQVHRSQLQVVEEEFSDDVPEIKDHRTGTPYSESVAGGVPCSRVGGFRRLPQLWLSCL